MSTVSDKHTIGRWLCDRARISPHKVAIIDRGVSIDYATLHKRAHLTADAWANAGYGNHSLVATLSGNSIEHVVSFFAAALLGAILMPMSWRLTPPELASILDRSTPQLFLADEEYEDLAIQTLAHGSQSIPFSLLNNLENVPTSQTSHGVSRVHDENPLLVIFTSGSEATPKGVVLTHENCYWTNMSLAQAFPLTSEDVVLSALPQHHVAAWNVQPLQAWWSGATVVLERTFQPSRYLQLILEHKVSAIMCVPTQYALLANDPMWDTADVSSLRITIAGGSALSRNLVERWASRGISLVQGYGLSEASANVMFLPPYASDQYPGAIGWPYPGIRARVVDPDTGFELSGATVGELEVQGPSVFMGYLNDEVASERAFHDGWLRTGDLVRRNADGVYWLVDRVKNIFVSGGENVAPAEVEAALLTHPHVQEATVVAVPDPIWGERGIAFVVVSQPVSADEILSAAKQRLASYKLPIRIEFLAEMPVTSLGKPARVELKLRAQTLHKSNHPCFSTQPSDQTQPTTYRPDES